MKMITHPSKVTSQSNDTLDKDGLKALHDRFFKKLYCYALQFVKIPEDAEEVIYDTFLKIWDRRNELGQVENIEAYLTITVKNLCLNRLGSSNRKFSEALYEIPHDYPTHKATTVEEELYFAELQSALQKAIEELPPQSRKVFQLVKEDGMKYKEVAEILGVSINTVDAHLAKAIKTIREALKNYAPKQKGKVIQLDILKIFAFFFLF